MAVTRNALPIRRLVNLSMRREKQRDLRLAEEAAHPRRQDCSCPPDARFGDTFFRAAGRVAKSSARNVPRSGKPEHGTVSIMSAGRSRRYCTPLPIAARASSVLSNLPAPVCTCRSAS